jgi:hypothetical protein
MFRDRLRQWRLNDKNRRGAADKKQGAMGPKDPLDEITVEHNSCPRTPCFGPSQLVMPAKASINKIPPMPEEMRTLYQALKGVLNWERFYEESQGKRNSGRNDDMYLEKQLLEMVTSLDLNVRRPSMIYEVTNKIKDTSRAIGNCFGTALTPLSVFCSVGPILRLSYRRDSSEWYDSSSRFLLQCAEQTFPTLHPSQLLLRLLFSNLTPGQLAAIYEVGSNIVGQHYGEASATTFRIEYVSTAYRTGMGVAFVSHVATLCAGPKVSDARSMCGNADLSFYMHRYEESAETMQRCLAHLKDEGTEDNGESIYALWVLASSQHQLRDFAGEDSSLRRILEIALARDRSRDTFDESTLGIDALHAISDLDWFYEFLHLDEQREALRSEFPRAFELERKGRGL